MRKELMVLYASIVSIWKCSEGDKTVLELCTPNF